SQYRARVSVFCYCRFPTKTLPILVAHLDWLCPQNLEELTLCSQSCAQDRALRPQDSWNRGSNCPVSPTPSMSGHKLPTWIWWRMAPHRTKRLLKTRQWPKHSLWWLDYSRHRLFAQISSTPRAG